MNTYSDHTNIEGPDILEALMQAEGGATVKQVAFVLTTGGPVDSNSARYDYVRKMMQDVVNQGLAAKEKEGRSYLYTITEDGRLYMGDEDPAEAANADEDEGMTEAEAEEAMPGTVEGIAAIADEDEARDAQGPALSFVQAAIDAEAEEVDADDEIGALVAEAEGDGMDLDVPEPPTPSEGGSKRGQRRVEPEVADETMEVPTHFPDNGDRRTVTRWLTGGEKCDGAGIIISEDATEDFGVEDLPQSAAFRLRCPHCGATKHANVNKDGVAKVCSHPGATGTPHPRSPLYVWQEGAKEWKLVDPTEDA